MKNVKAILRMHPLRVLGIVVLIAIAVFAVVRFAGGDGSAQAQATSAGAPASVTTVSGGPKGGSCCALGDSSGSGSGSSAVVGSAQISGGVQKISVDLSSGAYNPNVLKLKAGVPAEITFGQSSGCTRYVQSADLGFQADLGRGPQTVKLPGLQPGTYGFACGMNMVGGQIVVE
jgi:hypothetical protein